MDSQLWRFAFGSRIIVLRSLFCRLVLLCRVMAHSSPHRHWSSKSICLSDGASSRDLTCTFFMWVLHVRFCKYGYRKFSTCNILSIIHVYNTCLRHIYTHVYGIFIPILFALDIHFMYVMRTLYILNAFATLIIFCTPHAIWDCCFLRISYATLSLGSISWYNDFFLRSSPQIALSDSGILHTCLSLWGRWFIGGSDPAVLWLPGSCSSEIRILHLLSQVLTIVLNFVPVSRYLLQLGLIVIHPWWYDLLHDHYLILIP